MLKNSNNNEIFEKLHKLSVDKHSKNKTLYDEIKKEKHVKDYMKILR